MQKSRINPIAKFETIGYSKDIFYNGRYFGSVRLDEKDRETIGYYGRREETTDVDIKFKNKPKIPAGSIIMTQIHPLNGKLIK